MTSGKPALRVRGACSTCHHVVDTTAPKGRSTWTGPCPKGCGGKVTARRLAPGAAPAEPPAEQQPTDEPPAPRRRGRPIKKVTGYGQPAQGERPTDEPPPNDPPAEPAQHDAELRPAGAGDDRPGPGRRRKRGATDTAGDGGTPTPVKRSPEPETGRRRHIYSDLFPDY